MNFDDIIWDKINDKAFKLKIIRFI